jgi:aryl-alcohol dehydrogenase-like predicted oxidoreductase
MASGVVAGIGKPVSRLIQGTMWFRDDSADRAFAVLDEAVACGCTAIDMAHVYGEGASERIVGRWLRERRARDRVVLITKGGEPGPDGPRVTPEHLTAHLEESLDRLGCDSVDLYLVHVDDPDSPVGPVVEALAEYMRAGRISAYGVSNWTHERIARAVGYAREHKLPTIAASSVHLSLAEQVRPPWPGNLSIGGRQGADARGWYERERLPLLTWSSLAAGFFSGRFTPTNLDTFEDYFDRIAAETYGSEANFHRLDRARQLGSRRGLTAAQVALAWVMAQPMDVFALVGSTTPDEVRANARAVEVRLSPSEVAWLLDGGTEEAGASPMEAQG